MAVRMKSIIVGTAGHIDHGKTTLVKALTGIDADRLEEEKRRGITIDLGFAHMNLHLPPSSGMPGNGETLSLGFVDVPGHERFVRNLLAGVGGIDLVLLVIAADEAIKPQTREHFDILQLLGVKRGITVLTKSDAVDAETLEVVRMEVEEFLRGTFLEPPKSAILAVSSLTGAGLEDLKLALSSAASQVRPRDSHVLARLPIDRVFTMKGFGTVLTGTLVAGTIHREDELEVLPGGRRVRVRGVQVYGATTDAATAGQRTAVNVAGAATEDLARGMTLVPPATFETTRRADVQLRLLPSAPHPLKTRARVHFHSNTMEIVAEVVLHPPGDSAPESFKLRPAQLLPAQEAFVRLKFPQPAFLLPGDRFIIRQFSPVITIGGGVALDATPILRMPGLSDYLTVLGSGDSEAILKARIARRHHHGLSIPSLVAETGWTRSAIENQLAQAVKIGTVVRAGELYLHGPAIEALKLRILNAAKTFHKSNPLVNGISKEELRSQLDTTPQVFETVAAMLARDKKLEVLGDLVRLPGHGVVMKDDEAESKKQIEDAFSSAGLKVPALPEVLAGLKVDKVRAQKIVTLLLRDKVLIKISDELVFHRAALDELRRQMAAYKTKSPKIDVATFKELTGVTRKYAIPLLEYLDRERVTRRVADAREIL
jgi:selenocysteine-specific elongation factor